MNAKWVAAAVAIVVVVGAASGFGGYTFGVQAGQTRASNARASFLNARGLNGNATGQTGRTGAGGFSGQQGGLNSGNFAAGQVKQVDGNTIQLSTATEVLTIKVTDQTQIQKMGTGTVADLQPGERITVQGTRGSDGTLAAQRIQLGGGGPQFTGGPGQAPAGQPPADQGVAATPAGS